MNNNHNIAAVSCNFVLEGRFVSAAPYGSGHINDTYCAEFDEAGTRVRYIVQRINHLIFRNPAALMENIRRVTDHINRKLAGQPDARRRTLTVIPTRDGNSFYHDTEGNFWRTYVFIEKAKTYDKIQSPHQAFDAASAFGMFQKNLADMPPPRLNETIPDFHNTPKRIAALEAAVSADPLNRAATVNDEIRFAMDRKETAGRLVSLLAREAIPERITHNDTKLNNIMLDDATGRGICVIDLDTVMPGLALYDFGDMVRTSTNPAPEDERDLSRIEMNFEYYEAVVRGYLSAAEGFLTPLETSLLAFSGKLITLETGVRFLTDFLLGDKYFKIHREGHNLDRCRTQFQLVRSMEFQEDAMIRFVESEA